MIAIENLHKSYHMGKNSLHVLKGINFTVSEGEMVSILTKQTKAPTRWTAP